MQEYRNSLRSERMIKRSFLEILKTKDISKITIKEVSDLADLSRNTFYAHYDDVYAVNEAIEDDVINMCLDYLDEAFQSKESNSSLPFLVNVMKALDKESDMVRTLLKHGTGVTLIDKFSDTLKNHFLANLGEENIKDQEGLKIFLDVVMVGTTFIIREYLNGEIKLTPEQIAEKINEIYSLCAKNYIN